MAGNGPNSSERNIAVDTLMKTNRDASVVPDYSIIKYVEDLRKRIGMSASSDENLIKQDE